MIAAFLHGLYVFGWNDWAFTNKLLGWLILLAYGATGALIVRVTDQGLSFLVRTFVAAATGIVLLKYCLFRQDCWRQFAVGVRLAALG